MPPLPENQTAWQRPSRAALLVLALALLLSGRGAVGSSARRLFGHVQDKLVQRSRHLGRHDASDRISLAISLGLRDPAGFADLLKGLYDPNDPRYQQYITPGEFRDRYAPTDADVTDVSRELAARGLRVQSVSDNNMLLTVEGSAGVIESAFGLELHDYLSPDGRRVFAPNQEPVLFGAAAERVTAVTGLSTFALLHHPSIRKKTVNPLGVGNAFMTPAKLRKAYGVDALAQTGTGETVVLYEFDGYTPSDITTYAAQYGLTAPTLQNVYVSDGTTTPTGTAGANTDEVTLDIEMVFAMAPGVSKIMVYEAPNTIQGLINLDNKIANDNLGKEVSISWGNAEDLFTSATRNAENTAFQQMAAQGQSVFVAAGDTGAYDNTSAPTVLDVDDPASQPYVTAVGGTRLTADVNTGAYTSETSWSNTGTSPQQGGGGGISKVWSQPSWQTGLSTTANKGSSSMRMVPDVSLDADPNTGYDVYITEPGKAGAWYDVGGTSAAAPLWAAFMAIVNQGRVAASVARIGFANPSLYAFGESTIYSTLFNDIADSSTNLFYPAVTGYDLSTGWGTIKGSGLYSALSSGVLPPSTPSSLSISAGAVSVTLTWSAVSGATSYNVYSSPTGLSGSWVKLASPAAATYTDATANALTYYYVTAVNAAAESAASNVVSGYINEPAPGAPPGLSVSVIR